MTREDEKVVDLDDMIKDFKRLQELEEQKDFLEEAIAVYKKKLGDAVLARGGEVARVAGVKAFYYKRNGTFRKSDFERDNPHIAKQYRKPATMLDIAALREVHPDLYAQYQGFKFNFAR